MAPESLPKLHDLNWIMRTQIAVRSTKYVALYFKNVKVMKDKERLRNQSRLKDTKET